MSTASVRIHVNQPNKIQICQLTWILQSPSKHLKGRSAPRVSDVFADSKDFVVFLFPDTFCIQGILLFLVRSLPVKTEPS